MNAIMWLSRILIPFSLSYVIGFGLLSGRPVFDDFLDGAKEGMNIVAEILPTLLGMLTAVGILRTSGFLDALTDGLTKPAVWFHIPPALVPVALVRLVSNSAAIGLVLDIFRKYGPDSPVGMAASVMMGSTETVFYCISIYFGATKIRKTRYVLPGALLATAAGIAASIWLT